MLPCTHPVLAVATFLSLSAAGPPMRQQPDRPVIALPDARHESDVSLERTLHERRSVREFSSAPLDLAQLAQLLWAAQGVTGRRGERTAPSAGALYPLEIYLVAGSVEGLRPGLYRYLHDEHALQQLGSVDLRAPLAAAALRQDWMEVAPITIVIAADVARTAVKYGERAARYVHIETGAVGQNIYLQATALGLGTTLVGAFSDARVKTTLGLPREQAVLGLMPVGARR